MSYSSNGTNVDLERLRIAARAAHEDQIHPQGSATNRNVTAFVHAGFRLLQCAAALLTLVILISEHDVEDHDEEESEAARWNADLLVTYSFCVVSSLILAIFRIVPSIPNPREVIEVPSSDTLKCSNITFINVSFKQSMIISLVGFVMMLYGAIMSMRYVQVHVDIDNLSDEEIAEHPIFVHKLTVCAISILGSSVYLVHAWLCYDCWWWEKKKKKKNLTQTVITVEDSDEESELASSQSSETVTDQPRATESTIPDKCRTKDKRGKRFKRSRFMRKLRRHGEKDAIELELAATMNEIYPIPAETTELNVEDEPVQFYCCCVDLGHHVKERWLTKKPAHEFQVIHVM